MSRGKGVYSGPRNHHAAIIASLCVILAHNALRSEEVLGFGIKAGVPRMVEDASYALDYSLCVGGVYFYKPVDFMSVGASVSYNVWNPRQNSLQQRSDSLEAISPVEKTTVTEIGPFVRFATSFYRSPVNAFAHLGGGISMVHTTTNALRFNESGSEATEVSSSTFDRRIGFSGGAGLTLGSHSRFAVELFPLYHIVLMKDKPYQFYSTSLMFIFGLL
jgi:hypothetical protein